MHPSISLFPSLTFYEGTLRDAVSAADRSSENLPTTSLVEAHVASLHASARAEMRQLDESFRDHLRSRVRDGSLSAVQLVDALQLPSSSSDSAALLVRGQVLGGRGSTRRVFARVRERHLLPFQPPSPENSPSSAAVAAVTPSQNPSSLPPDAPPRSPSATTASSASGPFTPAQLHGISVVSRDGRRIPLDSAPVRVGNIADTGSGTIALGFDAFQRLVALDPHCVEQVMPLRSSIMSINGIGDGAHSSTSILFHVRLTLELGGSLFTHEDVPVCRAISGLLLGNDFNVATRASYHYGPFSQDGVSYDGNVVLNSPAGQNPSKPIPFSCRPHPHFRSAFVAATTASPEAVPPSPTEDEAESIIKSLNPIAYVDTRTVVPAWSEKIVAVRAPAALLEGYDVAILPLEDERREDVGVAVSPGMYRPDAKGMIHIRVVNASIRPRVSGYD
ncbi:hypothetical protein AB1Y20_002414 [Prymnesium parvum]|uniref:Uncharacterized protein n=1 Tax=Prymnesium parvum TaxID=97485 RepID=A0AB34J7W4_PRYPA